jgi:tRNA threonylcarbamoyladenosine biosynthesis protein TsaB
MSSPLQPPSPSVLAIDTSTEFMALGLHAAGRDFVLEAPGGAAASATLLPSVATLLKRAGVEFSDLDFIAFGCGPGAFTGLRTACAVAQGLGFGLGLPLLSIDSLLIVAEDARRQLAADAVEFQVAVAMDARMDEVYAGVYRWQHGAWSVLQPPRLCGLAVLADAWAGLACSALAGTALAAFGDRLQAPSALCVPQAQDRAAALLALAQRAAATGAGVDAAAALPLYLRDRVALTTLEREAARPARVASGTLAS